MKSKLLALLASIVVALGVSVSAATPARAALGDCTAYNGVICLWQHANAGGGVWRQTALQIPESGCRAITESGWNNSVSSFMNRSPGWVYRLYDSSNCTGTWYEAYTGFTYSFDGSNPWNDKFSSINKRYE